LAATEEATEMRSALVTGIVVVAAACGGPELPDLGTVGEPSYAEHLEPLLLYRCLDCHTAADPQAELVLEPGTGYGQLLERHSVQVPTLRLVEPGDLQASYLWRKLVHRAEVGKGMPRTLFGTRRLPDRELELIRMWIETGAGP
jgi:hypothetical protein